MISVTAHLSQTGFFISFEGSEGCGKSTQIRLLVEWLSAGGTTPVLVRDPGGTSIGETIRHLLKHAPEGDAMAAETELLLFAASRAQLVRQIIHPALEAGKIVISDRFLDSTTVYQGVARKIPLQILERINSFAAGTRLPEITFLLDMDPFQAHRRLTGRSTSHHDRMEQEAPAFYEAVRNGYLKLAVKHRNRIRLVDAARPQKEIAREVREVLRSYAIFKGVSV
jgi:dTMP kinase